MHPALSVIFFTVSSGAGLGLLSWLIISREFLNGAGFTPSFFGSSLALAFALIVAGLLSSTLHLANRVNAWRALSRFKTSWLSREGVFALLLLAFLLFYAYLVFRGSPMSWCVGWIVLALALALVVSTGMIYACLKTIPRWHTRWVPFLFVLYALWSGLVIWLAFAATSTFTLDPFLRLAAMLGLGTWLARTLYETQAASHAPSMNDALGMRGGQLRLLDAGHTHGTFLTREFGYQFSPNRAAFLGTVVAALVFAIPLFALVWEAHSQERGGYSLLSFAAACAFVGLLIDRWMFFAKAKHVVMLYHGRSIR